LCIHAQGGDAVKNAPVFLGGLFVLISIARVGEFVSTGIHGGWPGWVFSIALACSVFVSAYYARYRETRLPALVALVVFLGADLFFNEIELARTLSAAALVAPESNFVGMNSSALRALIQLAALVFGALQTIAAGLLGWLQAGADRVPSLRARAILPKITGAIVRMIDGLAPQIPAKNTAQVSGPESAMRKIDGANRRNPVTGRTHKTDLRAEDKAQIAGMSARQIVANYGGSLRRAEQWIAASRDGRL
jgi:hypothetical protein